MRAHHLLWLLTIPGLAPGGGVIRAQAVPRTDTPRAGALRLTFDPTIEVWAKRFVDGQRRSLGASLPATVFVQSERRTTPLVVEYGLTDRIALSARMPLVRVRNHVTVRADSAGAALSAMLADTTYAYAPLTNTRRRLHYFPGDAELQAKIRLVPRGPYAAAAQLVIRLPTGHLDSPHDLFDLPTGDHQTDLELAIVQELTLARLIWLNVSVRGGRQRPGTRVRRVAPQATPLVPRAATASLAWDPGDYAAVDVAPLLRLSDSFGAGFTVGYWTTKRDRYTYRSTQDSIAVATRLGAPAPASLLDAGTAERRVRLGAAVTYAGPNAEGGLSIEQTVSGAGGSVPAGTVFRIVLRTSRWPF
ncbi:MAG: hypothetical protein ACREMC_04975 [Gemmatimonadales bacterium]